MIEPLPISASTKIVGIFGDPVAHSRSPTMQNAAFAALGLDFRYLAFHVAPTNLRAATQSIRALGIRGVNVTVPHKESVRRYLDSESDLAHAIGAVNTIVNQNGHLRGENTDLDGFVRSLRARKTRLRNKRAVVIGAGGASRAVLVGLKQLGVAEVFLANRTRARSRRLVSQLGGHAPVSRLISIGDLASTQLLDGVSIVVNATPLGWGKERFPEIAVAGCARRCLFYDMAYGTPTDFLEQARNNDRPAMDGGEMLVLQGARSFTLWTGKRAPVTAMRIAFNNKY